MYFSVNVCAKIHLLNYKLTYPSWLGLTPDRRKVGAQNNCSSSSFQINQPEMSSPVNQDYGLLPELVFDDIMLRIGLNDLESLHRCRQVCKSWNDRIMRNIWDNPSKRNLIKIRIEKDWGPGMIPSLEEISHAKWLGMYSYIHLL